MHHEALGLRKLWWWPSREPICSACSILRRCAIRIGERASQCALIALMHLRYWFDVKMKSHYANNTSSLVLLMRRLLMLPLQQWWALPFCYWDRTVVSNDSALYSLTSHNANHKSFIKTTWLNITPRFAVVTRQPFSKHRSIHKNHKNGTSPLT